MIQTNASLYAQSITLGGDSRTRNRTRISTDTHGFLMILGQIRENLRECASKFFVGVGETGILNLPHSCSKGMAIRDGISHARLKR